MTKNFYFNLTFLSIFIGLILLACLSYEQEYRPTTKNNFRILSFLQGENSFSPIKKDEQIMLFSEAEAILMSFNGNKNKALFSYNAVKELPMASITKLMTASIVIDDYDLKDNIKITEEITKINGDPQKLLIDGTYSVRNLLQIMLIESNNEAAEALAQKNDRNKFIQKMNAKADLLNMEETLYLNPSGLDLENGDTNLTSAKDLEKLINHIVKKYPLIAETLSKTKYTSYNQDGIIRYSSNTNILLSENKDFLWGKTGFTDKAKGCLILVERPPKFSFFEKNYIINIIIGTKDRFKEAREFKQWIANQFIW